MGYTFMNSAIDFLNIFIIWRRVWEWNNAMQ